MELVNVLIVHLEPFSLKRPRDRVGGGGWQLHFAIASIECSCVHPERVLLHDSIHLINGFSCLFVVKLVKILLRGWRNTQILPCI